LIVRSGAVEAPTCSSACSRGLLAASRALHLLHLVHRVVVTCADAGLPSLTGRPQHLGVLTHPPSRRTIAFSGRLGAGFSFFSAFSTGSPTACWTARSARSRRRLPCPCSGGTAGPGSAEGPAELPATASDGSVRLPLGRPLHGGALLGHVVVDAHRFHEHFADSSLASRFRRSACRRSRVVFL